MVVNYANGKEAADAVVSEIARKGGKAIAVQADLSAPEGARHLFDRAEQEFGGVDVLVNNAGVMALSPVAKTTDEAFAAHLSLNVGGVFRGMREAAIRLREGGRIISFSSSVVGLYQPGYGVYAATKAAVEALTHVLAKEVAAKGITANCVAPGPVATELFLTGKSEELVANIAKMSPFGRLGEPEDIACVVRFLAGSESGWINGQTIRANGGVI